MILNEFDAYSAALKKINLNESAMPIYRGRILTENVDIYCKIQKLLNCPSMEQCHRWLYDLDVENLDESECGKVNNLFKLGLDNGHIEDDTDDEMSQEDPVNSDMLLPVKDPAPTMPATPAPAPVPATPAPAVPMAAYTIVYSATRDGEIKTGEAYSNSINTRSAKADVIGKLEKAGYQNISILAIEAGDPDMSGCDNTFCKQSDYVVPSYEAEDELEEADDREPLAHSMKKFGYNASTANSIGQDAVQMNITEDEAQAEVKKAFDEVNKQVKATPSTDAIKTWLKDNEDSLATIREMLSEKAKKEFDEVIKFLNDYSEGKLPDVKFNFPEAKTDKKPTSGVDTLVRGIFKVLCTLVSLSGSTVGLTGKAVTWAGNLITTSADKVNMMVKDSEEPTEKVEEAGDEEEYVVIDATTKTPQEGFKTKKEADDAAIEYRKEFKKSYIVVKKDQLKEAGDEEDVADENATDEEAPADDKKDEEAADEKPEDKKEETAEEPDEKLKDDKKDEEGTEAPSDDKKEKELTGPEKSQLKDSYKKAFKAAMIKCKFVEKAFDDLTLEEKVNFFTELEKAWGTKADPSKFMTDKELEQIEKIVIKK